MTDLNNVQTGNDSGNIPVPVRVRKTHISARVIEGLKKLSRGEKTRRNKSIDDRNTVRELERAKHEQDPLKYPSVPSADSSLVTVSDAGADDTLSPSSRLAKALASVSPSGAAALIRAMGLFKRGRDADDNARPSKRTRELRPEVDILPGMAPPVVFHPLLKELWLNDIHIPLSLLTSPSLKTINANASTIELPKHNASRDDLNPKGLKLLDTAAFERNYLAEAKLDRGQWQEAAQNFVAFIAEISGDEHGPESTRWHSHFGFFDNVEDAEQNFPAVLHADISLRREYIVKPFV